MSITPGERGFIVATPLETIRGEWATEEMARAVDALDVPTVEEMTRDRDYWRDMHKALLEKVRSTALDYRVSVYEHTAGRLPSPQERKHLAAARSALLPASVEGSPESAPVWRELPAEEKRAARASGLPEWVEDYPS